MRKNKKKKRNAVITILVALFVAIGAGFAAITARSAYLHNKYPVLWESLAFEYANENNLDPILVLAMIKTESNFKENATSHKDARGLMQIRDATFEWVCTKMPKTNNPKDMDIYDPEVNIRVGTFLIAMLYDEFGDMNTALAAYNAGRTNVIKWLKDPQNSQDGKTLSYIPFDETRQYVAKIEEARKWYNKLYYDRSK